MKHFFVLLVLFAAIVSSSGCTEATSEAQAQAPAVEGQIGQAKKPLSTWSRFRGPNGNGIIDTKLDLLPETKQLWKVSVGDGNASLIVDGDRLYTVGLQEDRSRALWCLNSNTGATIWKKKIDTHHQDSSPTLADGKLYLLCTFGKPIVRCFNAKDGTEVWSRQLDCSQGSRSYGFAGSTFLWNDLIFVNVGHGVALKKSDGSVVWEHAGASGLATPVLYHEAKKPYVMFFAGDRLVSREARTGKYVWSFPWKTDIQVNACDPIYRDGKAFVCTTYGKYAALFDVTKNPPEQVWKDRGSSFSSGFLWKGHLYCFGGGVFSCLDFKTGKPRWRGPHADGGSAILSGDKIILLNSQGRVFIAPCSTEGFEPTLEAQIAGGTTWTPPSLVGGRLYVRNNRGQAVCLQIAK